MIDYKKLKSSQLIALRYMSDFNCGDIDCSDCPLFMHNGICGSTLATNIIIQYKEETKQ